MATKKKLLQVSGGEDSYWIALLGSSANDDVGYGVATDSQNNIIMAGSTKSDGAGGQDALIVKYDSEGTVLWDRTLGGSNSSLFDDFFSVAVDSSDNIIAAGRTANDGAGGPYDLLFAKYNSSGSIQWQRTLGGTSNDFAYAVSVDSSDNIIIGGHGQSDGAGGDDIILAKYNSSGVLQWVKNYGGTSTDRLFGVTLDSSDNIYIGGQTGSGGAGGFDIYVSKFNSSGVLQWDRVLGGASTDNNKAIALDSNDNVIVCGGTLSAGAGSYDVVVAKYNSSGTIQWQKLLGGTSSELGEGVATDSSDNIYVCAYTGSDGAGSNDILIVKYNASGVVQWQKTLGGTGSDIGRGITVDANDNIIITGEIVDSSDWAIVAKLPPDGSGDGTYGVLTYQDSTLTEATSTLTDAAVSLTVQTAVLTDAASILTNAAAVLTETLYTVE